jgi:hypothetical protein
VPDGHVEVTFDRVRYVRKREFVSFDRRSHAHRQRTRQRRTRW